MTRETQEERKRPAHKYDLLQKAIEAEEPVTEVDESGRDGVTRVHAIQEYDGVALRATIKIDERSDGPPRIQIAKSSHDSDVGILRDWNSIHVGGAPRDLPAWESMFTVYNAVMLEYRREVTCEIESQRA